MFDAIAMTPPFTEKTPQNTSDCGVNAKKRLKNTVLIREIFNIVDNYLLNRRVCN
jgi:hypothetical protein